MCLCPYIDTHQGLVFNLFSGHKPLLTGPDDHRLLTAPVVRVAVCEPLLVYDAVCQLL